MKLKESSEVRPQGGDLDAQDAVDFGISSGCACLLSILTLMPSIASAPPQEIDDLESGDTKNPS